MLGGANRAPRPRPAESAGGAAGAEGWDEIGECPTAPSPTKQNPKTQLNPRQVSSARAQTACQPLAERRPAVFLTKDQSEEDTTRRSDESPKWQDFLLKRSVQGGALLIDTGSSSWED